MSLEANKTLVRRYFEDAPHNPDACDEIFADKFLLGVFPETKDAIAQASKVMNSVAELFKGNWYEKSCD